MDGVDGNDVNGEKDDCNVAEDYGNVVTDDDAEGKDHRGNVEDDGIDNGNDRGHPALAKLERDSVNPLMDRVNFSFLILLIKMIISIIFVVRIIIFSGQSSDELSS